jgi:hypothetical protein
LSHALNVSRSVIRHKKGGKKPIRDVPLGVV